MCVEKIERKYLCLCVSEKQREKITILTNHQRQPSFKNKKHWNSLIVGNKKHLAKTNKRDVQKKYKSKNSKKFVLYIIITHR
jgi:hypothetical protein